MNWLAYVHNKYDSQTEDVKQYHTLISVCEVFALPWTRQSSNFLRFD